MSISSAVNCFTREVANDSLGCLLNWNGDRLRSSLAHGALSNGAFVMSNPFADYGKRATSTVPDRLIGPIGKRADARARYAEIVTELGAYSDPKNLEKYLAEIGREIAQFRAELPFLWEGDGDFLGLQKEIERAQARVDDGLDFPRWEPSLVEEGSIL